MIYRHAIDATAYVFDDLRDLLAKATPPRSGDRLAGVAAESAAQMIAARIALADVPLKQFLQETVIPYEDDEVTRLIVDSHDAAAFAAISSLTVGVVPRLAAVRRGHTGRAGKTVARGHARNGGGGVKTDAQPGSDPGREKMPGDVGLSQHHRPARADERAAAAQSSLRRCQGHHRLDPRRPPAGIRRRLYRHQSGQRRSRRDRRAVAAARRYHRPAADPDAGLRSDPCDDHARIDRAGLSGRSGVSVDRGHARRRTAVSASISRCCARPTRPDCRCAAATSAAM